MVAARTIRLGLYNVLLAAGVFLPAFLLGSAAEVKLRGLASFREGIGYHLGAAAVIYLSMVIPVMLGSVFHSIAIALVPATASVRTRRTAAVVLAPLVPSTVIFLDSFGGMLLSSFLVATAVATVAYALATVSHIWSGVSGK